MRSLGATHRQVFGLLVGDVALLGFTGVAVGMPLGYLVARANIDRVSATVSNLYLLEDIHQLVVPPWFFILGAAVGLLGAGLGALMPALELGRRDTRSLLAAFSLHERVGENAPRLFVAGVVCVLAVVAVYLIAGDGWRPAGFLQAFLLIVSIPLLAPLLVQMATAHIRVESFGLGVVYGVKGLGKQLQTTPVAVAALAIAVSMVTGVTTMVSSFRETLDIWIDSTVRADIYVSTPSGRRSGSNAAIDDDVLERLRRETAVTHVDRMRQFFAHTNGRRFSLAGVDSSVPRDRARFALLEGEGEMNELPRSSVLVGEPLARKEGLHVGDDLVVDGPEGPVRLPIAGIYYDYSGELGSAFMHLDTMVEHFGEGPVNNIALYITPESDAERVVDELKSHFAGTPINFRSNRGLRERAMRVFDQTFTITRLLRYMSLLIAVCGVALDAHRARARALGRAGTLSSARGVAAPDFSRLPRQRSRHGHFRHRARLHRRRRVLVHSHFRRQPGLFRLDDCRSLAGRIAGVAKWPRLDGLCGREFVSCDGCQQDAGDGATTGGLVAWCELLCSCS